MKDIDEHPEKPWNWYTISHNRNITMKYILDHPGKQWVWYWISINPNIQMKDIVAHPDFPWNWELISGHMFTAERKELIEQLKQSKLL